MKPSSTDLTGESKTFHFALATGRYKDNRIPPKGFDIGGAAARVSVPVWHGVEDPNYFTGAEYAGGYDDVSLTIASGADYVEVNLYYQTTSREYIEFLRDEINGTGNLTLPTTPGVPGPGDPAHYIVKTDPFFSQLKAWGDTIWQLWTHNMNADGAAPFLMTSAAIGVPPTPCAAPVPTLLSATPGSQQIDLEWSVTQPPEVGFTVYYDLEGKGQWIADINDPAATTFTDVGLTNGMTYCYKVTSRNNDCESDFSNILCAIPKDQQLATIGVSQVITLPGTVFRAGDTVNFEATVLDGNGVPVQGAVVTLAVTGPTSVTRTSNPSDASGIATASWQTTKRGKNKTPAGSYTVTVTNVTLDPYVWDGVQTSTTFSVQ
jgi:hypothetical protein